MCKVTRNAKEIRMPLIWELEGMELMGNGVTSVRRVRLLEKKNKAIKDDSLAGLMGSKSLVLL